MKVTVILDNSRITGMAFERVIGVFSDYEQAVEYCNVHDPEEKRLVCEEYDIDELVDESERPGKGYVAVDPKVMH